MTSSGRPIWEDLLSEEDRRALDPGVSDALDPRPDVLVVGGGIVGLATAAMCVRAGLGRVLVVERRERCAAGPSGRAAGGLSPDVHRLAPPSAGFVEIARSSLALARELDDEWGGALGLRSIDWLFVVPETPPEAVLGPLGAELVDGAGARAIEPSLGRVPGAVLIRDQAHVDPLRYVAAFARRAGAVATGVEVLALETANGRVAAVRTSRGDMSPGAVVLATGTVPKEWCGTALEERVKGHLIATAPAPFRLRAAVASVVLVLQLVNGQLLAGGTFDVGDETPEVRDEPVSFIRRQMARLVPASYDLGVERAWCCFRPGGFDRSLVIDRVPGLENAWVSARHFRTGLLLAPGAGRALASWIATGRRPAEVESFALVGNG